MANNGWSWLIIIMVSHTSKLLSEFMVHRPQAATCQHYGWYKQQQVLNHSSMDIAVPIWCQGLAEPHCVRIARFGALQNGHHKSLVQKSDMASYVTNISEVSNDQPELLYFHMLLWHHQSCYVCQVFIIIIIIIINDHHHCGTSSVQACSSCCILIVWFAFALLNQYLSWLMTNTLVMLP